MHQSLLDTLLDALLVASILTTGLVAGLFYAFSCAVMPGLRRTDDAVLVATMTAVNRAIQNPVFAVAFVGTPLLSGGALAAGLVDRSPVVPWTLASLVLYLVMLAITAARNVPLNTALDRHSRQHATDDAQARRAFERPWSRWNTARTLLTTAALACSAMALLSAV